MSALMNKLEQNGDDVESEEEFTSPEIASNILEEEPTKCYEPTHSVKIETHIKQLGKGQDQTFYGHTIDDETGEEFDWIMVCDGHGTHSCISAIRSISADVMNKMIASSKPVQCFASYLLRSRTVCISEESGSTMCLVKRYSDRIVCINCGDSRSTVYKNGERVYLSKEHNWQNADERARVTGIRGKFTAAQSFELLSETHIQNVYSEYANFSFGPMLACTQAIGHNDMTQYAPDEFVIPYSKTDKMRVVAGSDGIWDVIMENNAADIAALLELSSEQILDRYVNRWKQDWNIESAGIMYQIKIDPKNLDDVSVIVMDINPIL